MKKNKKKSLVKEYQLSLFFSPLLKIKRYRYKSISFKKPEVDEEDEFSLDCSGQGECQVNVSPSDGKEKMDFYQNEINKKSS